MLYMIQEGISVIIPAYNEAHAVADTIRRAFSVCALIGKPHEVIVVDDGSTDGTGCLAVEAGARVLRNPANGGYGLSLQRGVRAATHGIIAITDADGTYPIEEMPHLYADMQKGFDMAVGARQGKVYEGSLVKSVSRKIFKWLAEYVAGRHIPDINSGLRMFRRDLTLPHLQRTCFGFSFTTSLTLIFMLQGYFVSYMPIDYRARVGKTKVRHMRDTLRTLQIMTQVILRYNPVKLFLLYAVLIGVAAALVGAVGAWLEHDSTVLGAWILLGAAAVTMAMGFLASAIEASKSLQ